MNRPISKTDTRKNVLRNPTPEEIKQIDQTQDNVAFKQTQIQKDVDEKKVDEDNEKKVYSSKIFNDLVKKGILKPKRSRFEPDPIPVKLPSLSFIIPKEKLSDNNEIFIRRFGSEEEDMLVRATQSNNEMEINNALNSAINNCLKTDVNFEDFSIIDKMYLLIVIVAITYENKIDITEHVSCNTCKKDTKITLDLLKDLDVKYVPEDLKYPYTDKLETFENDDIEIEYGFPLVSSEKMLSTENFNTITFLKEIISVIKGTKSNGKPIEKREWDDILRYMGQKDRKKIRKNIEEMNKYGIQTSCTKFKCSNPNCSKIKNKESVEISLSVIMSKIVEEMTKED